MATVSGKIIGWANFLSVVLGHIPIWLSKETIQKMMPQTFRDLYPETRVILALFLKKVISYKIMTLFFFLEYLVLYFHNKLLYLIM